MADAIDPHELLDRFLHEVDEQSVLGFRGIMPSDCATGKLILNSSLELQVLVAQLCFATLRDSGARLINGGAGDAYLRQQLLKGLASRLLRRELPIDEAGIVAFLSSAAGTAGIPWELPWAGLLAQVERFVERNGVSSPVRDSIASARNALAKFGDYGENKKLLKRIDALTSGGQPRTVEPSFVLGELWSDLAMSDLAAMNSKDLTAWRALISHCLVAEGSKPTKKWLKSAKQLIEALGREKFINRASAWLDLVGVRGNKPWEADEYDVNPNELISGHNATLLKGLVWCCIEAHDDRLITRLGDVAERCYRKIPMHGPRNVKVGNACTVALAQIGGAAVAQLGRLKTRAKHASVRGVLDRAMTRSAEKAGISPQELEEQAVPSFGLTDVGLYEAAVGESKVRITVESDRVLTAWFSAGGKQQKSIPAQAKAGHAARVAEIKKLAKDIDQMVRTQRLRIEGLFLQQRRWNAAAFFERYLHHRLVGCIARRLIWRFIDEKHDADGIWWNGRLEDIAGNVLTWVTPDTRVEPWHPLHRTAEQVVAWRRRLEELAIRQPFKQAHREIYVVTDAERQTATYSNRFAAHIIRQHQFAALCQQRTWRYTLQGPWDSHNVPHIDLPLWDIRAEFWVEPVLDEEMVYFLVSTDQVRFHRIPQRDAPAGEAIAIDQVPAMVFTEIMRDVDLFVGVASVGNDPTWQDGGPEGRFRDYWQHYSFGELAESAKTRRTILEKLIPRLKIAPRCSFDDKFLVVRGDLRTYKIHLGSGNILMTPNDQYLCIVPARGAAAGKAMDAVFLPFDGDERLSIILSKAFMLAEDTKIKDATITRQIAPAARSM